MRRRRRLRCCVHNTTTNNGRPSAGRQLRQMSSPSTGNQPLQPRPVRPRRAPSSKNASATHSGWHFSARARGAREAAWPQVPLVVVESTPCGQTMGRHGAPSDEGCPVCNILRPPGLASLGTRDGSIYRLFRYIEIPYRIMELNESTDL